MNISIVIYSHGGNTLKLAEIARDKLINDGHKVDLVRFDTTPALDTKNPVNANQLKLVNLASVQDADAVVIGGPVWAFRPVAPLPLAIKELGGQLKGKPVLAFVTHSFPWAWLTGTSSVNTLRRLAADQGAKALPGVVLSGAGKQKQESYEAAAEQIRLALK